MFEVLLTRIFSLTMWFHFAFMAISLAMFGLTAGALLVFLRPERWPDATLERSMGRSALGLAISMAAVIFLHITLYLPSPAVDMLPIILTFIAVAVPFVFSGVFICLALTRFPAHIGRLYAADLAGAAIGCLAVVVALRWLDGVGAVLASATLAALSGAFLLRGAANTAALLVTAALGGAAGWTAIHLARHDLAAFEIRHIKSSTQADLDYERWNSFSRIAVLKPTTSDAVAWSLSPRFTAPEGIETRWLHIDSIAGTQLVRFDRDPGKLEFLRWDLPNFVHHLRSGARVAIVGPGGGRDVLTAKLFGQKRVVAVEINGDIMRVVNGKFGEFTGHLDRDAGVSFVNDEARSYLARRNERFDIIQLEFHRYVCRHGRRRLCPEREPALHGGRMEGVPRSARRRRAASGVARREQRARAAGIARTRRAAADRRRTARAPHGAAHQPEAEREVGSLPWDCSWCARRHSARRSWRASIRSPGRWISTSTCSRAPRKARSCSRSRAAAAWKR